MYIIGDSTCASGVPLWKEVIGILESRGQIGPSLRLRCSQHPETELLVSKPEHFEIISPEGGCNELCGKRLDCGHRCDFLCHAKARHKVVGCRKQCERGRPNCGHGCQKRCSDKCGDCNVIIKGVQLPCGHNLPELECWKTQDLDRMKPRCTARVTRTMPHCGHDAEMYCWESPSIFKCQAKCDGVLACRHKTCNHPCYKCAIGPDGFRTHSPCSRICGKDFTNCSHRCTLLCHPNNDCGMCTQKCEFRCEHSRCSEKCGVHCVPCAEPCTWSCEHYGACDMPCGAPCDRLPCDHRCENLLECNHRCPSICGEVCPTKEFCQQCCAPEIKETTVEYLEFSTYEQTDLNLDPIIILPCKHLFTRSYLDCAMKMNEAYIMDRKNHFVGIRPNGGMRFERVNCHTCRMPISRIQRYNRLIKMSALDTILRNVIGRSQSQYLQLATEFEALQQGLEADRDDLLGKLRPIDRLIKRHPLRSKNGATIANRMKQFNSIQTQIRKYLTDVDESKQPHIRVYRMSIAAKSRAKTDIDGTPGVYWPSEVPSPDIKHRLLGNILDHRLEMMRNAEMIQFANRLLSLEGCKSDAEQLYKKVIEQCFKLGDKALSHKRQCDERQYPNHAVELILLKVDLVSLAIRASRVVEPANVQKLRNTGTSLLDECEEYFLKYPSCQNFKTAAKRSRDMLRVLGPFYEAVSQQERSAIKQAMQGEFGSVVRWYYCLNGHPVHLHKL